MRTDAMTNSNSTRKRIPVSERVGEKYNRLTLIRLTENRKAIFRCDCGGLTEKYITNVTSEKTKSCGCYNREAARKMGKLNTHGCSKNPSYGNYHSMMQRCYNPKADGYDSYGAVGITVCDEWKGNPRQFINDMGPRPSKTHSLDRYPNKKGNYEPSNCRWATPTQQARNTRSNRLSMPMVRKMRKDYATGKYTIRQITQKYAPLAHNDTVGNALNNNTWKE